MGSTTRAIAFRWASAAALALGLVMSAVAPSPAAAADPITMSARALLGGRYTVGTWLAISVSLANDGAPTAGTLSAPSATGDVLRAVDLPAGARKEVVLYVRPAGFTRQVIVTFTSAAATVARPVQVAGIDIGSTSIALVGDANGAIKAQIGDGVTGTAPFDVPPGDLPERPEPISALSVIVWAGDSGLLTDGQRRTLERWVAGGGQLIVIGGPDWQARTAGLGSLLPVTAIAAVDDAGLDGLGAVTGPLPDGVTTATVATGTLAADARTLVPLAATDARPLLASVSHGAGQVVWIGADLASRAFVGWEDGGTLWSRLIGIDTSAFFGGKTTVDEASAMTQALANLPALEVPPAELLLLIIAAYVLLIGPVSYFVLRRLDRRELAWVTAPALVILFSAGSYGIGTSLKGSQIIVNQISIIRSTVGGQAADVTTWAGIFSPSRATYDLTVPGDALLAAVATGADGTPLPTEQGDPAHLRGLSVNVFGMRAVRADTLVARESAIGVTWRLEDGRLRGTVTNVSDGPLADVAVVTGSVGRLVGDLAAGASKDFAMAAGDFTGASPADQVYGFARGDISTGEARTREIRRQVIVGLVGYGNGMPLATFGANGGEGPYVIGWHDEGPIDVEVDGEEVQRYAQSAEVVSGRPAIDPGSVQLRQVDIGSRVTATQGQVDVIDGRGAQILDGTATWTLSLPLEVRGLVASDATIHVATDPTSALVDQDFGGALPPGFTLEILDPTTDAWTDLGNVQNSSRFAVPDPATMVTPDGSITVRMTAGGDNPGAFGTFPIYVTAAVQGTLP